MFGQAMTEDETYTRSQEFQLLKTCLPTVFERFHPVAITGAVRHIHDQTNKVVPVENAAMAPMSLYLLRFVACRTEVLNYFEDGICDPFRRNIAAVIEPQG